MLKMSQTKDEFLQQYIEGLRDSQDINIGSQLDQDLMNHNLEVDGDYGRTMGLLVGHLMDKNVEAYEDKRYRQYIDHDLKYSDDDVREYYESTNVLTLRNRPASRIYSNQDIDIIKHASRNYLYQEMKQALNDTNVDTIDDENVFDVLNNSLQPHCQDERTREMLNLASDVVTTTDDWEHADDPLDSEYETNQEQAWNEYDNYPVVDPYVVDPPEPVKTIMDSFGEPLAHDMDKVLASDLIAQRDKDQLLAEHQDDATWIKRDSTVDLKQQVSNAQQSVSDVKSVDKQAEVQREAKSTVKPKKHVKKRRKSKSNDGPEM